MAKNGSMLYKSFYKLVSISLFILIVNNAYGQKDPEAITILDRFSSNAMGAPSVSMKFQIITTDLMENTTDTLPGTVILSKNKYKLDLPDNIIWFNGETSWSYLPAEKEVTITKADRKDKSFQNRPSEIFSMYKSGYKCRLIEERSTTWIIDLYPEDIKSDLTRVRLEIGKSNTDLKSLEYKKKDGLIITLQIEYYSLKENTVNESFEFQPLNFKGVEIIDMR